jgi:hypothetical protein
MENEWDGKDNFASFYDTEFFWMVSYAFHYIYLILVSSKAEFMLNSAVSY